MSVVVEEIIFPGRSPLTDSCPDEIEVLILILMLDTVLESLRATLQQSNTPNPDEHPAKRRKTVQNRPRSLAEENGVSITGTPLGYIPLARLTLRMVGCD